MNIELLLRKIHAAKQLNIYGAVSSWSDDSIEKMLGQTSTRVDNPFQK